MFVNYHLSLVFQLEICSQKVFGEAVKIFF